MKGDTLLFRFPNGEKQEKFGFFQKVNHFTVNSGFILADFNLDEKYIFTEGNRVPSIYYNDEKVNCSSKEEYLVSASQFLDTLREENLSKAIFSRVKKVEIAIEPKYLFDQLCAKYPNAFVYLVSSDLFGTWIGATPEILMKSKGKMAETISLAGTLSSDTDEEWTKKEQEEQQFVSDFIREKLIEHRVNKLNVSNQQELFAGPVKHLLTRFNFEISNENMVGLITDLHPTPAVSGLPRDLALDLIRKVEKHKRKFYAGIIGFLSATENKVFVNLRCAEIQKYTTFLYVGGGFTKDSSVEKEWDETERKAETLLNVMQKN